MFAAFVRRLEKLWICNIVAAVSQKGYLRMYVKFLTRGEYALTAARIILTDRLILTMQI